jgi:hypothetical protein
MRDDVGRPAVTLVTAAQAARVAGVTRAAVSNWRRRYDDFPAPAGGSSTSPLFSLPEIQAWLDKERKGHDVSHEVRLWQALGGAYEEDAMRGLTAVAEFLAGKPDAGLPPELRELVTEMASGHTAHAVVDDLTARYTESAGRRGADNVSTPRLIRAIRHFAGTVAGTVFDPACGIGSVLFTLDGAADVARVGQEIDPSIVRFAELRAELTGLPNVSLAAGDSLRSDQWAALRADLVICEPPVSVTDWGREDLLLDPRWEFGVPSRAEGELAWLQHCYFHTAPAGRVVLVMPASVAYRKAGRRIRAELVRRGLLTHVVALPAGMAASHALPVHLWLLRRPSRHDEIAEYVRMTDLTPNDPDGGLDPADGRSADISRIDLLDDTVDLTPAVHIPTVHTDYAVEYATARAEVEQQLATLLSQLPDLPAGPGSGSLNGATVSVSDLARAGLVEASGNEAVSTSEQLDTHYLNGFLRSASNTRRSTSTTGTFRTDTRGSRIPQMAIDEQRRYGAAFRSLDEFTQRVRKLAELSEHTASLARDGLTNGALTPPPADA